MSYGYIRIRVMYNYGSLDYMCVLDHDILGLCENWAKNGLGSYIIS